MRIPDYYVRVIELPRSVRGVTVPNDDGTFSVYINALYDTLSRRDTLEHELAHLARDHFYKSDPIALQETEASGESAPPSVRQIRMYRSLRELEDYLRSIGALESAIDKLGKPW